MTLFLKKPHTNHWDPGAQRLTCNVHRVQTHRNTSRKPFGGGWKTQYQRSIMSHPSGRLLEKGMAIHSSILAWRIPWTEKPSGLQSVGLQRVGHTWANKTYQAGCQKLPSFYLLKLGRFYWQKYFFTRNLRNILLKASAALVEFKSVTRAARLNFYHVQPLVVWSMFSVYQRTPFPRCGEWLLLCQLGGLDVQSPLGLSKNGIHRPKQTNHMVMLTRWVNVDNMG